MANPFDQFDTATGNPFDQFDATASRPETDAEFIMRTTPELVTPPQQSFLSRLTGGAITTRGDTGFAPAGTGFAPAQALGAVDSALVNPEIRAAGARLTGIGGGAVLGLLAGGPPGAYLGGIAGAAATEPYAQSITPREESLAETGINLASSALPPLGRVGRGLLPQIAAESAYGIGVGEAQLAGQTLLEQGRLPTAEEFRDMALISGAIGAGTGLAMGAPNMARAAGAEPLDLATIAKASLPSKPEIPKSTQILTDAAKPAPLANVAAETASATQGSPYALQQSINKMVNIAEPVSPTATARESAEAIEQQLAQREVFERQAQLEEQFRLAKAEEAIQQAEAARLAQPEQVILTSSPANQQLQMLDTRPGSAQAERARLIQQIEAERPALPQITEPMLSPQAQRMQDEYGRVNPALLAPLAGSGAGGAAGFAMTERQEGESEEAFQARRLRNALVGAVGGGALASAPQIARNAFTRASSDTVVSPSVGKNLGIINDFKPIADDVSNAKIRLDRFGNTMMRGTKMRKPFVEAKNRAEAAINSATDEARIVLADARGKINALAPKGPERDALEQKLNEVFADINRVSELPEDLQPVALRMFKIREDNATKLAALEGLSDTTRNTILENGGDYLARNYAIFRLNNPMEVRAYKAAIPKEDMEAALDAIQETWTPKPKSPVEQKLAAQTIESAAQDPVAGVEVIKSLRPWMTDSDAAKVAAWVTAGKQGGNPQVRALYGELINPSEMSRTEAQSLLNDFLDRDNFLGFTMGRKQIGGKDITSLYRKKEIDPRLRKVLGEVKDPLDNVYHSIENQVNLIERDKQQRDFIDIGEKMGIFTRNPDEAAERGMVPFVTSAKEQNNPYDNWTGVYVNPVFRDEFAGAIQKSGDQNKIIDTALGSIKAATAAFKWLKLIPSPDSRSVNLVGAWWNNAVNGRGVNPATGNSVDGVKAILLSNGLINPDGSPQNEAIINLRKTLVKHRVLDESTLGKDFADNFNESILKNTFGKIDEFAQREIDNPGLRKAYLTGKFLASGKEFAAADDVMRVVGFLNEKEAYRRAFPNIPEEDLNEIAGRVMNQTGMTYSEVPAAIRQLSQVGILEPFTSFPYSVFRSTANSARLGYSEIQDGLRSGNQELVKIGARRLTALSLGVAAASGYGVSQMINREHGVTEEQEAAAKTFAPDYVKDSPLAFDAPVKNGKVEFVQMNYLLPTGLVTSAIEEGINEAKKDGLAAGAEAAVGNIASQFSGFGDEGYPFGPAIVTIGKAMGIINKDDFGRQIWNPQDPQKWDRVAASIGKDWAPGVQSKIERLYAANNPEVAAKSPGRVFSNKEELLRFLGRRATTVDVKKLIPTKAFSLYSDYLDASKLYSQEVSRDRLAGDAQATAQAFEQGEAVVNERFNDMVKMVNDARILDVSDDVIRAGLIQGGVPKKLAAQIMAEVYVPPSKERADALIQAREMKRENYRQFGAQSEGNVKSRAEILYDRLIATPEAQRGILWNQLTQSGEINEAIAKEIEAVHNSRAGR